MSASITVDWHICSLLKIARLELFGGISCKKVACSFVWICALLKILYFVSGRVKLLSEPFYIFDVLSRRNIMQTKKDTSVLILVGLTFLTSEMFKNCSNT